MLLHRVTWWGVWAGYDGRVICGVYGASCEGG